MSVQPSFQSSLRADLIRYISLKQALGRQFRTPTYVLHRLDRFLCTLGKPSPDLTEETFRLWSQSMQSLSSNTRLARMLTARNFCLYRRRTVPACFVPDHSQFPQAYPRPQPYILSDGDVARILSCSKAVPESVRSPLRRASTRLAVVLLYTTGLRRGELLSLSPEDYDRSAHTLLIRNSKFYKSRLLPLPNDVAREVESYLSLHQKYQAPQVAELPLFWNPYCGGRAYSGTQLRQNLRILLKAAGIRKPNGRFPRIHDFRFSFAANALVRWYRSGADVQAKLPLLAAYMGHVSILTTYYYLRFIEPLAAMASEAFAKSYGSLIQLSDGKVHQ
jgi:integrase/recombinase XerD